MYPQSRSGYERFEPEHFEFAFEEEAEVYGETETAFTEAEEMELALELLEVSSEAELDQFLGSLVKKAVGGIKKIGGKFLKPLGGILKGIAKKALPFVGGALGSFIPIPGVGTMIGRAVGTAASNLFEVELEGMEQEEAELEVARRFVRFGGAAARRAAAFPRGASPYYAAKRGATAAARRFAPGLYRRRLRRPYGGRRRRGSYFPGYGVEPPIINGRWIRRGPTIVLPNCYGPDCYGAPANGTPSQEPYDEPTTATPQGDEGDEGTE